ncbi:MAG: transposase [Desulfurococcaceae archaeon]
MEKTTVTRTVVVESEKLPRRVFRVFVELEEVYRSMVEQLVLYAVGSRITSFTKLKALKYRELRNTYPHIPSHYAYTACQDACTRAKSFLKLKKRRLTNKEYPEVKDVSIWFDDHLWKLEGLTRVGIATHRGWIHVDIKPHKQFWRYVNSGWRFRSECRVKLNKRERKLILYFVFAKDVELYQPKGYITVDVNENSIAVLVDGRVYLFETNMEKIVLGYYYRRKRVQEKYDSLYGPGCRARRRVLRKLNEKGKKSDARWKIANIVVREAVKHGYAIAMEKLGKRPAENMIKRVKNKQLKHRIYQASFRGVQRAVEEKAKEHGVSVVYIDPRNTSKQCPVHGATIRYDNSSRIGICSTGGERWHRDVVACFNLLLKALGGDGSNAPNHPGLELDGSPVPLGSTATHEPIQIPISVWGRWKSLDTKEHKQTKTNIQGQTEPLKHIASITVNNPIEKL